MTASPLPPGEIQFADANGAPYAGGSVAFYIPGTTTPKDTWQNRSQTVLNANPIPLDAAGRAIIWGNGLYRQILKDAAGNTIWDQITEADGSGLSGVPAVLDSRSLIATSSFDASVNSIIVNGYATAGDGGFGTMVRMNAASPNAIVSSQSEDAAWWWMTPENGVWSARALGYITNGQPDQGPTIQSILNIFTDGAQATASGEVDFYGAANVATPLTYAGGAGYSLKLNGKGGAPFNPDTATCWRWTGARATSMFILNGANQTVMDGINIDVTGGAVTNAIHDSSDNIAVLTTTIPGGVTAGQNVSVTPTAIGQIVPGCCLGVGAPGPATREIIYVKGVSGGSFVADFTKNHAANCPVGGSAGSSGFQYNNAKIEINAVHNSTTTGSVTAGANVVVGLSNVTNVAVGTELSIDVPPNMEKVFVAAVSGNNITATFAKNHANGCAAQIPNCGILVGNFSASDTMQVSETEFNNPLVNNSGTPGSAYTSLRIIKGGNVKDHVAYNLQGNGCSFGIAIEGGSGRIGLISPEFGGSTVGDIYFDGGGCSLFVSSLAVESVHAPRMLVGQGAGPAEVTMIGPNWQSTLQADHYFVDYPGSLTIIGGEIHNLNFDGVVPKIRCAGLAGSVGSLSSGSVSVFGTYFQYGAPQSRIFFDGSNNCMDAGDFAVNQTSSRLQSMGNFGDAGYIRNIVGEMGIMSASMSTDFATVSTSFNIVGSVCQTYVSLTLGFSAFQAAALNTDVRLFNYPVRTRFIAAYADVTAAFSGPMGPITLQAGASAGTADILAAGTVSTAPVTLGLLDADMGTGMTRAAQIQGAYTPAWGTTGAAHAKMISASGNLSGLTAGSVNFYFVTERLG